VTQLLQDLREELVRRDYAASTIRSYVQIVDAFRQHTGARLDGPLLHTQPRMLLEKVRTLRVENIGHLHGGPAHGGGGCRRRRDRGTTHRSSLIPRSTSGMVRSRQTAAGSHTNPVNPRRGVMSAPVILIASRCPVASTLTCVPPTSTTRIFT
jgi:hypothetical protein